MKNLFMLMAVIFLSIMVKSCSNKYEKELSFLTFNVWQEGTSVPNGFYQIRDVIIEINPDIVCFVEVRNYENRDWTSKIIQSLEAVGLKYYRGYIGGDVSFISKYPIENGEQIFSNSSKGTIVKFDVNVEGKTIIVSGAHLDYTFYASNLPRGYYGGYPNWKMIDDGQGAPVPITNIDTIQAYSLKSTRDEAILSFVQSIKNEIRPVILMGDFNEPSFLDWTANTQNMFGHNGVVVPWHNTYVLNENMFVDAYRSFYPNALENPGFTWPSNTSENKSTSWTPLADERDRVDYIFYRGNGIDIKDVSIVGPKESFTFDKLTTLNTDKDNFIASNLPWPSDHKAVYAKLVFTLND